MNILVTGANGQLGNEMQIVSKASSKDKYIFTDVHGQMSTRQRQQAKSWKRSTLQLLRISPK